MAQGDKAKDDPLSSVMPKDSIKSRLDVDPATSRLEQEKKTDEYWDDMKRTDPDQYYDNKGWSNKDTTELVSDFMLNVLNPVGSTSQSIITGTGNIGVEAFKETQRINDMLFGSGNSLDPGGQIDNPSRYNVPQVR